MQTSQLAPLGLSDLTQDECLIVSISRAWRRIGTPRAVAEHSISRLLQTDRIHPALDALFAAFDSLFATDLAEGEDSDVLSRSEETLLDELSAEAPPDRLRPEVRACQAALRHARIELRPLPTIERSGHDRLVHQTARSYQILMHMHS